MFKNQRVGNSFVKDGKGKGGLIVCTLTKYVKKTYGLLWALSVGRGNLAER
jgi:hypothetical protein